MRRVRAWRLLLTALAALEALRARCGVPDPYAVLGVPRGASTDVVKSSYHKLAQRYHPDKVQLGHGRRSPRYMRR